MKITERENLLFRRALDKATTPAEAETAAKAFIASLRSRGLSGYDFVPPPDQRRPEPTPEPSTPTPKSAPESNPTRPAGWTEEQWQDYCREYYAHYYGYKARNEAGTKATPAPDIIGATYRQTPSQEDRERQWMLTIIWRCLGGALLLGMCSFCADHTPPGTTRIDPYAGSLYPASTPAAAPSEAEKRANWQRILDMRAGAAVAKVQLPVEAIGPHDPGSTRDNPVDLSSPSMSAAEFNRRLRALPSRAYFLDAEGLKRTP